MKPKLFWQRASLTHLPRLLRARGAKRFWLKDRSGQRHVLLPFSDYADLLAYKRHALSWAELTAEEQNALHEEARRAQSALDGSTADAKAGQPRGRK